MLNTHDQVGNRWSTISKELSGRTSNRIKNFFLNSIKKGMNILNHLIREEKKNWKIKPFRASVLKKVYLAIDEKTHERIKDLEKNVLDSAKCKTFVT